MMSSIIPNQQKICSKEVVVKSESLFEIENFSGYRLNEEINFEAETFAEVDISWFAVSLMEFLIVLSLVTKS